MLHEGRSYQRWMRSKQCQAQGYQLVLQHDLGEIVRGLHKCHGERCWVIDHYAALMAELTKQPAGPDFQIFTPGLLTGSGQLVAGEIGYRVGRTYTSVTGFLDRTGNRHNHAGKLQMHLLADYLRQQGYSFWNLGHPGMQYKIDLGGKVLPRQEFLRRWLPASASPLGTNL